MNKASTLHFQASLLIRSLAQSKFRELCISVLTTCVLSDQPSHDLMSLLQIGSAISRLSLGYLCAI